MFRVRNARVGVRRLRKHDGPYGIWGACITGIWVRVGVRRLRKTYLLGSGLGLGLGSGLVLGLGLGGRSNVQRDRPQNVMAEANLDVPFHCDSSFSMPSFIEM